MGRTKLRSSKASSSYRNNINASHMPLIFAILNLFKSQSGSKRNHFTRSILVQKNLFHDLIAENAWGFGQEIFPQ